MPDIEPVWVPWETDPFSMLYPGKRKAVTSPVTPSFLLLEDGLSHLLLENGVDALLLES